MPPSETDRCDRALTRAGQLQPEGMSFPGAPGLAADETLRDNGTGGEGDPG